MSNECYEFISERSNLISSTCVWPQILYTMYSFVCVCVFLVCARAQAHNTPLTNKPLNNNNNIVSFQFYGEECFICEARSGNYFHTISTKFSWVSVRERER